VTAGAPENTARRPGPLAAALGLALAALLWPGPPPAAQEAAPPAAPAAGPDLGGLTFKPPDARIWIVGNHESNPQGLLIEFVTGGETTKDWTEIVTMQAYKVENGAFPPPEKAVQLLEERMRARCPSVVWEVLSQTSDSVVYRWRTQGCGNQADESEVARILIRPDSTVRIAYTTRIGPLSDADRARLTAWLESFTTDAPR